MKKSDGWGSLSSGLDTGGFISARLEEVCCCSIQDTGKQLGGGRLWIWKWKNKIKRFVEEITLELDRTVNTKVEVRPKKKKYHRTNLKTNVGNWEAVGTLGNCGDFGKMWFLKLRVGVALTYHPILSRRGEHDGVRILVSKAASFLWTTSCSC